MSHRTIRPRTVRAAAGVLAVSAVLLGLTACGVDSPTVSGGDDAKADKPAGFDADAPLADLVPEAYQEDGVLVVGTQPDFEPANFTPVGEEAIQGYNVDLMEAMAAQLGLEVKWEKVPFDQLLIGQMEGRDLPELESFIGRAIDPETPPKLALRDAADVIGELLNSLAQLLGLIGLHPGGQLADGLGVLRVQGETKHDLQIVATGVIVGQALVAIPPGEQAAHIVDVLVAAHRSMREERPIEVTSSFPQPAPMPWAE